MTTSMTEGVTERVVREAPAEPGDHERLAHYANKDAIMKSMVDGVAIQALCGKKWVATRDGTKFPVCPECKEVWESLEDD